MSDRIRVEPSLFDQADQSVLREAGDWFSELLTGSFTSSLCIASVALFGILMLTGRIPFRCGLQVLIGCFLLLGAGTLAEDMSEAFSGEPIAFTSSPVPLQRGEDLPPAEYNPFVRASVRPD